MARKFVLVCDNPRGRPGGCQRTAHEYKIWREGEPDARRIDLCDTHARDLLALWDRGVPERLPAPPRKTMKVTPLKTTAATEPLKRKDPSG